MVTSATTPSLNLKLPRYSTGSSLRAYLSKLDDYFDVMKISDDPDRISIFKNGLPLECYEQFCVNIEIPTSYADYKVKLINLFHPEPFLLASKDKFRTAWQLPSETVHQYVARLTSYSKTAYPSLPVSSRETLVLDQIQFGLRHQELTRAAKLSTATTPTALADELVKYEGLVDGGRVAIVEEATASAGSYRTMEKKLDELQAELRDLKLKVSQPTQPQRRNFGPCFNCDRMGHLSRNCRQPPATCARCSGRHLTKHCRINTQQVSSTQNLVERLDERVNACGATANYTSAMLSVNDLTRCAMIDTGSNHSLLSSKLWTDLGQPSLQPCALGLCWGNGCPLNIKGTCRLDVRMGSLRCHYPFVVVDDMNVDILLGTQFFTENDVILNFKDGVLESGGSSVQLYSQPADTFAVIEAVEGVRIPANCEKIIMGKVQGSLRLSDCYMISDDKNISSRLHSKILVANSVVSSNSDNLPIRILNFSDTEVAILPGDKIAKVDTVQYSDQQFVHRIHDQQDPAHTTETNWEEYFPLEGLENNRRREVFDLLDEFRHVFAISKEEIGFSTLTCHGIDTQNHTPVRMPARRIPICYQKVIEDEIEWMLEKGIIRESASPWSAPIVMVKKKNGGHRMCVDYRKLNSVTQRDTFPLPRMDSILDSLNGNTLFSTLDLFSGFWQMPVQESDRKKTSFTTHKGSYEFNRLPFGLCNAPASFQRLMSIILSKLLGENCLCYMDDIIVLGNSFQNHLDNLKLVFQQLSKHNLTLKPSKCSLLQPEVQFLGHIVSAAGIKVDPAKVEAVKGWPNPTSKTDLKAFLGLAGYYRKFVHKFADIAAPLFRLSGDTTFRWDDACQSAFDSLKKKLCDTPVLSYPDTGESAGRFVLDTDASNIGLGGVLSQEVGGEERVIAYASKTLSKSERNYCVTRRELLAVVHFCLLFRPYLLGKKFLIRTDHASLTWLRNLKDAEGQLARWILSLQEFDFDIVHRPGNNHGNADGLSRIARHQFCDSCPSCEQEQSTGTVNSVQEDLSQANLRSLVKEQEEDHDIQVIRVSVEENRALSHDERNALSIDGLAIAKKKDELFMENNCMFIRHKKKNLPVLPSSMKREMLEKLHQGYGGGHFGMSKLESKVEERLWWPGYREDIKSFILGCPVCSRSKNPTKTAVAELHPIKTSRPNQVVATDIMGPLTTTKSGNQYILVIIDLYTKWVEIAAIKDQTSRTTIAIIKNEWISRYGTPERLLTDNGSNYISHTFEKFCREMGIQHVTSSPYHAPGNGQAERLNRTVKSLLKAHVVNEAEWDTVLPECLMAYRSSRQESTGFSPYQLTFGTHMSLPVDNMMPHTDEEMRPGASFLKLKEKLQEIRCTATQNADRAKKRQKHNYDRKAKRNNYSSGDAVWLYKPATTGNRKFHKPWVGPYKIIEFLPPVNYRLRYWGRQSGGTVVVHHNRLKVCHDVDRALMRRDNESEYCQDAVDADVDSSEGSDIEIDVTQERVAVNFSNDTSDDGSTVDSMTERDCRVSLTAPHKVIRSHISSGDSGESSHVCWPALDYNTDGSSTSAMCANDPISSSLNEKQNEKPSSGSSSPDPVKPSRIPRPTRYNLRPRK